MECPKLRPVEMFPVEAEGRQLVCLRDPFQYAPEPVFVLQQALPILQFFDAQHSVLDIQTAYARKTGGDILFSDDVRKLAELLDSHLMLESEKFYELKESVEGTFREAKTRSPTHAGSACPTDADELRRTLTDYFEPPEGPGHPDSPPSDNSLVGAVIPHIDLGRGGHCFAHPYKEILEHSNSDLFIILGVKHIGECGMYTTTYKDFETPLGVVKTDRDFLNLLRGGDDEDLLADEFFHKNEDSVEFQVVFLQFTEIENLRHAIGKSGMSVCVLASVDLSHVGRFGNRFAVNESVLDRIRKEDLEMLQTAEAVDTEAFLESIRRTENRRRVDGVCPIYTLLETLQST